jgi:hypothetical protein
MVLSQVIGKLEFPLTRDTVKSHVEITSKFLQGKDERIIYPDVNITHCLRIAYGFLAFLLLGV